MKLIYYFVQGKYKIYNDIREAFKLIEIIMNYNYNN
jgi:hypothetical protein